MSALILPQEEVDRTTREQEYLDRNGMYCPFCQSDKIVASHLDTDGDKTAWCEVECPDCKRRWKDIYNLIGITEIEP